MSENDPKQGGRRPDGPPDLDEIFNGLSRRISGLFGKGPSNPPSNNLAPVALVFAVLFVLWTVSGFYQVDESEDAVVMRFGRYVGTVESSGLHWRLPWPIESVEVVNMTNVRSVQVGTVGSASTGNDESIMLTNDQNLIEMQLEVQYTIKSAKDFVFNNKFEATRDKSHVGDDVVKQSVEAAIREVVGRNGVDAVLYENRTRVSSDTKIIVQRLLDSYGIPDAKGKIAGGTGIQIEQVNIPNVQPPKQVQVAFDDAVKARQEKQQLILDGEKHAKSVLPEASGAAVQLIQEATGYRQRVIEEAQGNAQRFQMVVAEYAKAPQVTRDRMYLDAMQEIYRNTTKIMVEQKSGGNLLYLPLDKLIQSVAGKAGTQAPQPSAATNTSAAAPAAAATQPPQRDGRNGR